MKPGGIAPRLLVQKLFISCVIRLQALHRGLNVKSSLLELSIEMLNLRERKVLDLSVTQHVLQRQRREREPGEDCDFIFHLVMYQKQRRTFVLDCSRFSQDVATNQNYICMCSKNQGSVKRSSVICRESVSKVSYNGNTTERLLKG